MIIDSMENETPKDIRDKKILEQLRNKADKDIEKDEASAGGEMGGDRGIGDGSDDPNHEDNWREIADGLRSKSEDLASEEDVAVNKTDFGDKPVESATKEEVKRHRESLYADESVGARKEWFEKRYPVVTDFMELGGNEVTELNTARLRTFLKDKGFRLKGLDNKVIDEASEREIYDWARTVYYKSTGVGPGSRRGEKSSYARDKKKEDPKQKATVKQESSVSKADEKGGNEPVVDKVVEGWLKSSAGQRVNDVLKKLMSGETSWLESLRSWFEDNTMNEKIPFEVLGYVNEVIEGIDFQGDGPEIETPEAVNMVEIPKTEKELRLFLRKFLKEAIRICQDDSVLNLKYVYTEIAADLGYDKETYTRANFFPIELAEKRKEVQSAVEAEIEARIVLRRAELQEWGYMGMADKGAALNRYVGDMKGSEASGGRAAMVDMETLRWLKDIENLGDGLSTGKVDKVFQVLLLMGETMSEDEKDTALVGGLARYRKYRDVIIEGNDRNLYHPDYNPELRAQFYADLSNDFGEDSVTLARQMFMAFKEEGNYNWQHYMSRLFTFAANRHSLATLIKPVLYTGSKRKYLENTGTYKDELQRVAMSPLNVRVVVGRERDSEGVWEDVRRGGEYLRRALRGGFLQESEFDSPRVAKYTPQQDAFNTVKAGVKFREAVAGVGELGIAEDKSGKAVNDGFGLMIELRNSGTALVDYGVFTKDKLDKQIEVEAENVLWELSVKNPATVDDLNLQTRTSVKFILPSKINGLFQALGTRLGTGERIVGDEASFGRLRTYYDSIRSQTWDIYSKLREGEDVDYRKLEAEEVEFKNRSLPNNRGESVEYKPTTLMQKTVNNLVEKPTDWAFNKLKKIPLLGGLLSGFE